jgi:integrase
MINDAQAKAILKGGERRRDRLIFAVAAYSGLRVCEILHIERSDIYPERGVVMVARRKKKTMTKVPVEMPADVLKDMEASQTMGKWVFPGRSGPCHMNKTKEKKGKRVVVDRTLICTGGHLSTRTAQWIWDAALTKLGIKVRGRGIHSMRHYHGTRFYEKTKDLVATQDRLGHSSPEITRAYVEVVDMKENVKKFGTI